MSLGSRFFAIFFLRTSKEVKHACTNSKRHNSSGLREQTVGTATIVHVVKRVLMTRINPFVIRVPLSLLKIYGMLGLLF